MILGLTGGIATGKSTVSAMFRQQGAILIDADQIARDVVEPGSIGLERVRQHFGDQVIDSQGRMDRTQVGQIIFSSTKAREELNQILHPLIIAEMNSRTEQAIDQNAEAIIIWDVPLLIEQGLTHYVEKVIVVYVPEVVQLERLIKRDQLTEEEALQRMKAQLSIEEKRKFADFVIDNRGPLEVTERQVKQLWNFLTLKNGSNQP
ncbi:dephospho-CoA kinase [Hazenella coriacea]|uniref:Dephospho-CoA kinase n=1 Tax=Hazenella coriacea TaxID=1179467 RepID=A0A4R3LEF7_9BACL|nr:dephospho-CoA kinase [Hazenella coriacea]TCS96724.1 dephospho-CoA kinase [Hazenella coriacea]